MKPLTPSLLALSLLLMAAPFAAQDEPTETPEERGLRVNLPGAQPGYTLFAPLLSKDVFLVDLGGEVVHTWKTDHANAWVYLKDNGNLLYCGREEENPMFFGGGIAGRMREYDWEGNLVWDYVLSDEFQTQHHDFEPLPNGNLLLIVWEFRFKEDALAMGRDAHTIGDDKGLWPDAIVEIEPVYPDGAEVVWEWHAWDHLVQDRDENLAGYGSPADLPERIDINADHRDLPPETEEDRKAREELEDQMRALGYVGGDDDEGDGAPGGDGQQHSPDWMHTNAVDYHPEFDLIVISSPELNEILIIDHSTSTDEAMYDAGGRYDRGGDVLWRWGNPRNYGAGDEDDQQLFYQHNPTFIPGATPDELRVLVYNNNDAEGEYSSVYELVLPFDPKAGFAREPGEAFGPRAPIWKYEKPGEFHSSFISGCQRLPNGNTLVCSGAPGRIFEVTSRGEIVWEYLNPYGGEVSTGQGGSAPPTSLFRATRIPSDHPAVAEREL